MELLEINRTPSRESTRAPDEEHRAAPSGGKRGKRKAYGPEAEAAELTKAKMKEARAKPRRSAATSSPYFASHQKPSSVFSQDPRSSQSTSRHDDSDVELNEGSHQRRTRSSLSSARPTSSKSTRDTKQEQQRRTLEERLRLERPRSGSAEGSGSRTRPPSAHIVSDEDEVSEPEESLFPSNPRTIRSQGRHVSTPQTVADKGKITRVVNSSPTRPANRNRSYDITASSGDEVREPIEAQSGEARLLSPDDSPPKFPSKPPASRLPNQGTVLSKKQQMRRKDGSRPAESKSPRQVATRSPRTEIPSSKILQTKVVHVAPASVDWAFINGESDEHRIQANNVSLRRSNSVHVLEFVGTDGIKVELPLDRVGAVQSNYSWFLRLDVKLTPTQRDAMERISGPLYPLKLFVVIALRQEQCSQELIVQALKIIQQNPGLDSGVVDNAAAKTFRTQWEKLNPKPRSSRHTSEASKAAAAAAEKRLSESFKSSKGKGPAPLSPSQPTLLSFNKAQPTRRSTRNSTSAAEINTLSDDEVTPATSAPRRRSPRLDKHEVLFPYPFTGRSSLDITKDSLYRLMDGDFLNDVTLEFGLRYTLANAPQKSLHLFNSFFYNKLSSREKKSKDTDDVAWASYESVKKWTKAVDVFQQDFIIVPVNENLHWYLAVILNPRAIIERKRSTTSHETASKLEEVTTASSSKLEHASTASDRDPLDCISDDSGVDDIKDKVSDIHISPKPIRSFELECINGQDDVASSTPPSPKPKKTHMREAYDLRRGDTTYIMTFDSLGGSHKAVGANLKRWLECEARDKLKKEPVSEPIYLEAKVPQQDNFSDCGVFVIHYVWCLLNETDTVLDFIGKPPPYAKEQEARAEFDAEMNRVWHAETTKELRSQWIKLIHDLNDEWRKIQGSSGDNAPESLSLVNGSQASVIQINAPESTGTGTLPPVDESSEVAAAPPDDAPMDKGILSPSPAVETETASKPSSSDSGRRSKRRSLRVIHSPPADDQRMTSEHPDPPSPILGPQPLAPRRRVSRSSGSPSSSPQPSSRGRSTSTKTSSKDAVDRRVLVEDSQPESQDSSSSILFSSDEASKSRAGTAAVPKPKTPQPEPTPVSDSSDDGRLNGRIDLSSDHERSRYTSDVKLNPPKRRGRDSSGFDLPSPHQSSHRGSSPAPGGPPSTRRRKLSPSASSKQKQGTLSTFFAGLGNGTPKDAPEKKQAQPEKKQAPPEKKHEQRRDEHKKPYVDIPTTPVPKYVTTYAAKDKGKRKASGASSSGTGKTMKKPRQSHGKEVGSSQNPIDLDPSDEE